MQICTEPKIRETQSLKSAIVTKIVQSGSETTQTSTLERLNAKYGASKVDEVEAQLAEIRMAHQDSLSQTQTQPDFLSEGNMHDMPTESKNDAKEESVADFLASAPSMDASQSLPKIQTTLKIN